MLCGDVQVTGGTDARVTRVHDAGRSDEIDVAWLCIAHDDGADTAARHGGTEVDVHVAERVDRNDRRRRRNGGLRAATRVDVAKRGPHRDVAAAERKDARSIHEHVTRSEHANVARPLRDDA